MKITTEKLERCEVLMTVEVEPQKEQKMLQKAAKKIARQVKIPGFRPGKAPYNVVVRRFGSEAVQKEAMEQSIEKLLQDVLEESDVKPAAQVQLESIDWTPLTIKLKIPVQPIVTLNDYRAIRLDAEELEITEDDIKESLERFQEQTATWNPVERLAEEGDILSMSLVTKDGEKVLEEHESVEHSLNPPQVNEKHNHPDFTAPFLGANAGDKLNLTFAYPEIFEKKEYAGKDISWDVEIFSVKEKEVDPLDDDLAKSVSDFDTLDELKANIKENLQESRKHQQNADLGRQALDQIVENSQIEWPQSFEDERVEAEVKRQERQLEQYGINLDNYLSMEKKTKEDFLDETRQSMIEQIKRALVLGEIAELENISVSESDILTQAKMIGDLSGGGDQFWRNILASDEQRQMLANELLADKTLRWLALVATGVADGAGGVGGVPPLPSLRHTPSKIPEMQGIIGEDQETAESDEVATDKADLAEVSSNEEPSADGTLIIEGDASEINKEVEDDVKTDVAADNEHAEDVTQPKEDEEPEEESLQV